MNESQAVYGGVALTPGHTLPDHFAYTFGKRSQRRRPLLSDFSGYRSNVPISRRHSGQGALSKCSMCLTGHIKSYHADLGILRSRSGSFVETVGWA